MVKKWNMFISGLLEVTHVIIAVLSGRVILPCRSIPILGFFILKVPTVSSCTGLLTVQIQHNYQLTSCTKKIYFELNNL